MVDATYTPASAGGRRLDIDLGGAWRRILGMVVLVLLATALIAGLRSDLVITEGRLLLEWRWERPLFIVMMILVIRGPLEQLIWATRGRAERPRPWMATIFAIAGVLLVTLSIASYYAKDSIAQAERDAVAGAQTVAVPPLLEAFVPAGQTGPAAIREALAAALQAARADGDEARATALEQVQQIVATAEARQVFREPPPVSLESADPLAGILGQQVLRSLGLVAESQRLALALDSSKVTSLTDDLLVVFVPLFMEGDAEAAEARVHREIVAFLMRPQIEWIALAASLIPALLLPLIYWTIFARARALPTKRARRVPPLLPFLDRYGVIAFLIIGAAWPLLFFDNRYYMDTATSIVIYVMLGWGLNIVVGMAGLLDLGYVAFYAVGAYTFALISTTLLQIGEVLRTNLQAERFADYVTSNMLAHDPMHGPLAQVLSPALIQQPDGFFGFLLTMSYEPGLIFFLVLPLAGILAAIWGIILGFPVLRLRGDYLAIVTLAFGEIIRVVLLNWTALANGPDGVSQIPRPSFFGVEFERPERNPEEALRQYQLVFPDADALPATFAETMRDEQTVSLMASLAQTFSQPIAPTTEYFQTFEHATHHRVVFLYLLIFVLALLTYWVTTRLRRLPVGRAWEALREDEIACRSLGMNTRNVKLTAFSIGAMFGGFAGAFFATRQGFISPESFSFLESAIILAVVVLGGLGSQFGIIIAALLIIGGFEFLRDLEEYRMLILGALMVGIMVWKPRGLLSVRDPTVRLRHIRSGTRRRGREGRA